MAVSRETGAGPARRLLARASAMGVALEPAAAGALVALLDRLALEEQNLTRIEGLDAGVDRHLSDALAGLSAAVVRDAEALVDVGAGAGFPGLALAAARPATAVTLLESERRKAEWLDRASEAFPNVRVVRDRSEHLAGRRREAWPLAVARALGPPPVALELTAPLVALGGAVVLWTGYGDPETDAATARAAAELGLAPAEALTVMPFPGARRRLRVFTKTEPTPGRYPRRPGRAAKRPLGSSPR